MANSLPLGKPPILISPPINAKEQKTESLAPRPDLGAMLQQAVSQAGGQDSQLPPVSLGAVGGSPLAQKIIALGEKSRGVPYEWGGNDLARGVDCSGLVQQTYAKNGVNLPRTSEQQAAATRPISAQDAKPGDLVFYDNNGHVGIYLGNGQMLDSPHTGAVVRVEHIWGGAQFHRVDPLYNAQNSIH